MERLFRQTWFKLLIYILIVSVAIVGLGIGTFWVGSLLSNQKSKDACITLVLTSMDAPNGNRYVERTVHMPYFRTDNEGDCLKLTYASNGKNFYYEVDSSILESNVLVYQDGTLYYRFRKKSPSGQYGAEVTFRIDNASYESLNEVLSSSQLPIMSLEQYDKEDEQAILGLIAHSSVSGVVAENQMLSLNHRDYSRLNMVVRGNAITITSNDRELYRSSKVASDNMFGILVAKLNLNQSGDKQIVTDKSKFVFAFISDHLPR